MGQAAASRVAADYGDDAYKRSVVSVIVPTSNYASFLDDAIASVQAQTYGSWECIVVDDGSTDTTQELLQELTRREPRLMSVWQPSMGVSRARNRGLALARGEFVQFLDADDRLAPNKLADHVAALEARPDIDIVFGTAQFVPEAASEKVRALSDPASRLNARLLEPTGDMLSPLIQHNQFVIEAPLTRRTVFDAVGGFDERLLRMEDWDIWVRAALAGTRFAFVETHEPTVLVRVHDRSVSQNESTMIAAELHLREKLNSLLASRPHERRLNLYRIQARQLELGVLVALDHSLVRGWASVLMLALRYRRPRWLIWALILPFAAFPRLRRVVRQTWAARRFGAVADA